MNKADNSAMSWTDEESEFIIKTKSKLSTQSYQEVKEQFINKEELLNNEKLFEQIVLGLDITKVIYKINTPDKVKAPGKNKKIELLKLTTECAQQTAEIYKQILTQKEALLFLEILMRKAKERGFKNFDTKLIDNWRKSFVNYFSLLEVLMQNHLAIIPDVSANYYREISVEMIGFLQGRMAFLKGEINVENENKIKKYINNEIANNLYFCLITINSYCNALDYTDFFIDVNKIKEILLKVAPLAERYLKLDESVVRHFEESNNNSSRGLNIIDLKQLLKNKLDKKTFCDNWLSFIESQKISEEMAVNINLFFSLFLSNELPEEIGKDFKRIFLVLFELLQSLRLSVRVDGFVVYSNIKTAFIVENINIVSLIDKVIESYFPDKKEELASKTLYEKYEFVANDFIEEKNKEEARKNEELLLNELKQERKMKKPIKANQNTTHKSKKSKSQKKGKSAKDTNADSKLTKIETLLKEKVTTTAVINKKNTSVKKPSKKSSKRSNNKKANSKAGKVEKTVSEIVSSSVDDVSENIFPIEKPSTKKANVQIVLDTEVVQIFLSLKQIDNLGSRKVFGGYVRDKLSDTAYWDIDIFVFTEKDINTFYDLLSKAAGFNNCRISKNKHNFISAKFLSGQKEIALDITIGGALEPFLDTHAFCIDEQGMIEDSFSILSKYADLSSYVNREFILPLCSKEELMQKFLDDPIRIIKAIKESAKIKKLLHPDIVEVIKNHKNSLSKIPQALILNQLISISSQGETLNNFLNLIQSYGLLPFLFPQLKLQNLNDKTINWVVSVAEILKSKGYNSPYTFLVAPLIILSFYHDEMSKKEYHKNKNYLFYFSFYSAFSFLEFFRVKDEYNSPQAMTYKYWFSELFLGLYLVLQDQKSFHWNELKGFQQHDPYMTINSNIKKDNVGDILFDHVTQLVNPIHFGQLSLNAKFIPEQNMNDKINTAHDFLFAVIRALLIGCCHQDFIATFEEQCIEMINFPSYKHENFVPKIGGLINYLLNNPPNTIQMAREAFDNNFQQRLRRVNSYYGNFPGLFLPQPVVYPQYTRTAPPAPTLYRSPSMLFTAPNISYENYNYKNNKEFSMRKKEF